MDHLNYLINLKEIKEPLFSLNFDILGHRNRNFQTGCLLRSYFCFQPNIRAQAPVCHLSETLPHKARLRRSEQVPECHLAST